MQETVDMRNRHLSGNIGHFWRNYVWHRPPESW